MRIVIDFDPIGNKINSVMVDEVTSTIISTVKNKKTKDKEENSLEVVLGDNKLILTQEIMDLLNAQVGDRLIVRYKESNGFIEPFLGKAETFSETGGNKITKGLTISFRGDQHESLKVFGNKFLVTLAEDGSLKLENDVKVEMPPEVPKIEINTDPLDMLITTNDSIDIPKTLFQL